MGNLQALFLIVLYVGILGVCIKYAIGIGIKRGRQKGRIEERIEWEQRMNELRDVAELGEMNMVIRRINELRFDSNE